MGFSLTCSFAGGSMRSAEPTPILPKPERDALVTKHLRYAERYARRIMRRAGVDDLLDDILSEAYLGLVEASRRFDPARGVLFGTYAAWWVRKQVTDFIDLNRRSIRKSRAQEVRTVAPKIPGAIRQLQNSLCRHPTNDEIAAHLGVTVSVIERAQTGLGARDVPLVHGSELEKGHWLAVDWEEQTPEDTYAGVELGEAIEEALSVFSERDADILRRRLAGDAMLEEVGDAHGISRERVRQVQEAQTPRLRRRLLEVGKEWAA
jgi:RNA polymerase sigma factor (sigma-70 family)